MICSIDATVFTGGPILEAVKNLYAIISMGNNNVGLIHLPICHTSTNFETIANHTRKIEDALFKAKVDSSTRITHGFLRESLRSGTDKRIPSQICAMVVGSTATNKFMELDCVQNRYIQGLPLCAVSEMIGYDPDHKPSPNQRVAQIFGTFGIIFGETPSPKFFHPPLVFD